MACRGFGWRCFCVSRRASFVLQLVDLTLLSGAAARLNQAEHASILRALFCAFICW
jgi:hypothetical protein